jgi:hypothetical protein
MATRRQSWFDNEKLLHHERMVRSGRVRLRTSEPPYWWEGALILTTDRLFFLPDAENPLVDGVAFWLADVALVMRDGARRFRIDAGGASATFLTVGRPGQRWLQAIESVRADARPQASFGQRERAAG